MKILNVQSSASMECSLTRKLSASFLHILKTRFERVEIMELDLVKCPPPFITPDWIAGAFSKAELTEQQQMALNRSDEYIRQIEAADLIIIGTPMYNYGMPAVLKAWFDQIARINKTFSFDLSRGDFPIEPVLHGKKLVLFTSSGEFDFQKGGEREAFDHLVPHIKSCAHYLGVINENDLYHIGIEYQEFKDKRHESSKNEAFARITTLVDEICLY
ncbi:MULTISPECIES: FMN-dependent NADH-azoreductase [Niastella]|uniref:FMN dependent NADH:quinone oxidoreductase n=1 Tax=Niastella soli TaxID=2821487 RepID=A0ABS3YPM2_9BACT|nr:NAD(P)H-dependent oxidoreductase [Niastella soli]MBO9199405.1 NAD(P)H-dependent oxidoreductase [Niastella soli]